MSPEIQLVAHIRVRMNWLPISSGTNCSDIFTWEPTGPITRLKINWSHTLAWEPTGRLQLDEKQLVAHTRLRTNCSHIVAWLPTDHTNSPRNQLVALAWNSTDPTHSAGNHLVTQTHPRINSPHTLAWKHMVTQTQVTTNWLYTLKCETRLDAPTFVRTNWPQKNCPTSTGGKKSPENQLVAHSLLRMIWSPIWSPENKLVALAWNPTAPIHSARTTWIRRLTLESTRRTHSPGNNMFTQTQVRPNWTHLLLWEPTGAKNLPDNNWWHKVTWESIGRTYLPENELVANLVWNQLVAHNRLKTNWSHILVWKSTSHTHTRLGTNWSLTLGWKPTGRTLDWEPTVRTDSSENQLVANSCLRTN